MSKKATIVPGVHDLIPPDGLLTVELYDPDTGRVKHRVRAENSLMDWYRKNTVPNGGRGLVLEQGITSSSSYDSFNPIADIPAGRKPFAYYMNRPYAIPSANPVNLQQNWLWATDQNVSPDATLLHIPTGNANGEVTMGTKLDQAWTPDGLQTKRGSLQVGASQRTWARTRIVTELGFAYGNGTYRSMGIGSLVNQSANPGMRAAPSSLWSADLGANANATISTTPNSLAPTQMDLIRGCVDYEDGGAWGWGNSGTGLFRFLPTSTVSASLFVSTANHPGSGGQISYAVNGSDFWVGRNQTLYRCVKPTSNVAMTVTNTYALAGTLGAQTILDIAIDRVANVVFLLTSTHVHLINGTTGAAISNFAHGMTSNALAAIEWCKPENQLFVHFVVTAGATDDDWGSSGVSPSSMATSQSCIVRGFTTAGAAAKSIMLLQHGSSGIASQFSPYCVLNDWGVAWHFRTVASTLQFPMGPSMASHALLPSDVVKTSADALRITYDFDFV